MEDADDQARALHNLRGMAHPTRYRLLEALSTSEPRNVKTLAAAVGEPANSVSFHLRQLAKYALARQVEAPEGSSRRESFWLRTDPEPVALQPSHWAPEERAANLAVLRSALLQSALARIDGIVAVIERGWQEGRPPDNWVLGQYDHEIRLTDAEADAFRERLRGTWRDLKATSDAHAEGDDATFWVATCEFFPDLAPDASRSGHATKPSARGRTARRDA